MFRNICPTYVSLLRRRCPRIFLVVLQNAACRLVIACEMLVLCIGDGALPAFPGPVWGLPPALPGDLLARPVGLLFVSICSFLPRRSPGRAKPLWPSGLAPAAVS